MESWKRPYPSYKCGFYDPVYSISVSCKYCPTHIHTHTPPKSEILIPCLADVASCGEVSVKTALIIDHLNHQNQNQNYCHEHEHVHHCHDLAVKVREVGDHICIHCHCCCHCWYCYWKYEIKVPCSQSLSSVPQGRGELSFGRILVAALILPCNIIILN